MLEPLARLSILLVRRRHDRRITLLLLHGLQAVELLNEFTRILRRAEWLHRYHAPRGIAKQHITRL